VLRIHSVQQHCVNAVQLTYLVQCFVSVTAKHTARISRSDRFLTVIILSKVTCLTTESNQ